MLKVSGEALAGSRGFGLDPTVLESIAAEVQQAHANGIQVRRGRGQQRPLGSWGRRAVAEPAKARRAGGRAAGGAGAQRV